MRSKSIKIKCDVCGRAIKTTESRPCLSATIDGREFIVDLDVSLYSWDVDGGSVVTQDVCARCVSTLLKVAKIMLSSPRSRGGK